MLTKSNVAKALFKKKSWRETKWAVGRACLAIMWCFWRMLEATGSPYNDLVTEKWLAGILCHSEFLGKTEKEWFSEPSSTILHNPVHFDHTCHDWDFLLCVSTVYNLHALSSLSFVESRLNLLVSPASLTFSLRLQALTWGEFPCSHVLVALRIRPVLTPDIVNLYSLLATSFL